MVSYGCPSGSSSGSVSSFFRDANLTWPENAHAFCSASCLFALTFHVFTSPDPKLPGLHFELAEMLHSLPVTPETTAQTRAEYEATLAQGPFDEKADLELANMAEQSGDPKKSYELYARAAKL